MNEGTSTFHHKPSKTQSRRSRWKSQQNLSFSTSGNPNYQYPNQPIFNQQPVCHQLHQNHIVLSNPVASATSCCLLQQQDPFGNIYFVPQKPALDLGLCRGCRRIYAASPMIQNYTVAAGVSLSV